MFNGSFKFNKKARKAQKLAERHLRSTGWRENIIWDYDPVTRIFNGGIYNKAAGTTWGCAIELNKKGNAMNWGYFDFLDQNRDEKNDLGWVHYVRLHKGNKGLRKHINAQIKNQEILKSLFLQGLYYDNGKGMADFIDNLPGSYPYSSDSTKLEVMNNGIMGDTIFA